MTLSSAIDAPSMPWHKCVKNHPLRRHVNIRAVSSDSTIQYEELNEKWEARPPCTARYCMFASDKLFSRSWNEGDQPVTEIRPDVKHSATSTLYHDLLYHAEVQLQYAVAARVKTIDSELQVNTLGALRDDVVLGDIDIGRETIRSYIGQDVSNEEVVTHGAAMWMHDDTLIWDIVRMWRAWYCAERRVAGRQYTASNIDVTTCVRIRMEGYARVLSLLNGKRRDSWHCDTRTAIGILMMKTACVLPENVDEAEWIIDSVAIQIAGNWASFTKDVERYETACVWSVMNVQPEHVRCIRNTIVRAVREKNTRCGYTWRQAALYVTVCVWEATSKRNAPWVPAAVVASMLSKPVRALLSMTFVGQYDIPDYMAFAALEDVCGALLEGETNDFMEIPELGIIAFGL